MANTIEYADSPNVDTAFVVQEGGQKNRAVLTAPQDTTTLELPDNPNSTKGFVTIDGKKHKVILTADISGNGGGGGSSLPEQTGHEGQFLFTNGSTASWSDNVYTNTTTKTLVFDENTTEYVLHITPKANRDMFLNIMVYDAIPTGEGYIKGSLWYGIKEKLSYADISEETTDNSIIHTYNENGCSILQPTVSVDTTNSRFDCALLWVAEALPSGEEQAVFVDIKYSDGVNSITDEVGSWSGNWYNKISGSMPTPTIMPDPSLNNGAVPLFNGSDIQWTQYPFGNVFLNEWTDYNTVVAENGSFVLKYYSQVSQMPTPVGEFGTIFTYPDKPALFQYIGETDQDYTKGYFYKIYYVLDRNASASQTTGSSLSNFAVDTEICAGWLRDTNLEQDTYTFTFDGTDWIGSYGDSFTTADLNTRVGITFTGTPVADDVITLAFDQATWGWEQVNVQPSGLPVPPTTPNTVWVLKATVDANGEATIAWVQEV